MKSWWDVGFLWKDGLILRSCGIDTAQKSLGIAVIEANLTGGGSNLLYRERFKPENLESDFLPNAECRDRVNKISKEYRPDIFCCESPAYNARFGMVSVGTIHGVLLDYFVRTEKPFVYCSPKTMKAVVAGTGKAEKRDVRQAVLNALGNKIEDPGDKKKISYDESDAIALAFMGALFLQFFGYSKIETFAGCVSEQSAINAFFRASPVNKKTGKRPGICFRQNEFFWIPQNTSKSIHMENRCSAEKDKKTGKRKASKNKRPP